MTTPPTTSSTDTAKECVALYTDAGLAVANPSTFGGAIAWCFVYADGSHTVHTKTCTVPDIYPDGARPEITNNLLEFYALVHALEQLPATWAGRVCTDSSNALERLTIIDSQGRYERVEKSLADETIPVWLGTRFYALMERIAVPLDGRIFLVKGHPSKKIIAKLQQGIKVASPKNANQYYDLYNCYVDLAAKDAIRSTFSALYSATVGDDL